MLARTKATKKYHKYKIHLYSFSRPLEGNLRPRDVKRPRKVLCVGFLLRATDTQKLPMSFAFYVGAHHLIFADVHRDGH